MPRVVLLGALLDASGVEEEEVEGRSRRKEFLPAALEQLDVRQASQPFTRDLDAVGVDLDRDDALRCPRHGGSTLSECGAGFCATPRRGELHENELHLRDRRAAGRHSLQLGERERPVRARRHEVVLAVRRLKHCVEALSTGVRLEGELRPVRQHAVHGQPVPGEIVA